MPNLAGAKDDAPFGEVVGGKLDCDFVAGQDADVVLAHFAGDMRRHYMAVV